MLPEIGMSPAVVISCMWITRKKIDGEASSLKAKHIDVQPKFISNFRVYLPTCHANLFFEYKIYAGI